MQWVESIIIERPKAEVYRAVVDQNVLMQWSAWPEATGFTCRVEGDGTSAGSQIVFSDSHGVVQGRQTLLTEDGTLVRNQMKNRGPRGRDIEPRVDFRVEELSPSRTKVSLEFEVEPPVPAVLKPIAARWLTKSIRPLHVKDLEQLKALVERSAEGSPRGA